MTSLTFNISGEGESHRCEIRSPKIVTKMQNLLLLSAVILATNIGLGSALYCYQCTSAQAGCGAPLDIRMQRWHWCPDDANLIENFCVKRIQTVGSRTTIDRGCLSEFLKNTWHRTQMPTVRRHGYCENARATMGTLTFDKKSTYCFCNDWNGCNSSTNIQAKIGLIFSSVVIAVLRFL
ncbi:unnamed protein product [Owenia fusiformis]|uniref:Protein quiver n=1 Tax=Owenia fusiformis TaxID=6347 RepID=A0A8S4NYL5_OWEFU|nr:unnamed protein product [Owenia fusiformis]